MTQEMMKSDLNFVMSRCPKDIRKLLIKFPGQLFLAGGFVRAIIAGETPSDIDLFGISKDFLNNIVKDLAYERKGRYFATDNAITLLSPPRFPVQFITRWLYDDPEHLIYSFDFTICQSVIYATHVKQKEGDDRILFTSLISSRFYSDLAARRLWYTYPQRNEDAGGSLLRAIRFIGKGYNIQAPSLAGLIARLYHAVGEDCLRKNSEKWTGEVITGLLREVDPMVVVDGVDFLDEHKIITETKE